MVRPTRESSNRIFEELLEFQNQIQSLEVADRTHAPSEKASVLDRKKSDRRTT